jgi:hypothetical protein
MSILRRFFFERRKRKVYNLNLSEGPKRLKDRAAYAAATLLHSELNRLPPRVLTTFHHIPLKSREAARDGCGKKESFKNGP